MPSSADTHIQKTAPGPPAATAVATPTMLPVPSVAANAAVSAPKGDIPRPACRPRKEKTARQAAGSRRSCTARRRTVRKRPQPRKLSSVGSPHTAR